MPTTFLFNQTQLQVIKAMQDRIDCVVEKIELPPDSEPTPAIVQGNWSGDWINWNHCYQLQQKLYADAHDHRIPQWAVPNVNTTWNARRNRLGRGPLQFVDQESDNTIGITLASGVGANNS
ncbi:hypothetical protein PGTUg99_007563 [Puccinia graminis f. sp. tritici]|uniref:Uncharacterized protein n=1 Tax=Puccinia graminis f. sp. tritici TaxID=56615 RepID=A0A5B0QU77_PUCGR|nr:hypothetical protein PGTUg99_000978 [Puccinia graminis f. sp. tritici]KAA1063910.1 hypothetical protein PGTUg99_001149 [Puccinia graminis f. sp. tritici]KAA1116740.1 hypothetical protein PGTUg99_007974 [Puccinia graminis f. sp. tritici]KAA1125079.1 hypothetical protein PGTUg99_007563 [Puccinia graminis f. sp. tritici]